MCRAIVRLWVVVAVRCERTKRLSDTPPSDQSSAGWRQPPVQRMLIYQALEDEASYRALYRGVAVWASRLMGACAPDQAHARAEEIVQEAVAQALAKIDTYDPKRPAITWLLGFAINVIRRMRRRHGYEATRTDSVPFEQQMDLIDRLHSDEAQELLELVNESDQQVLRLAVIEGVSGRELAAALGTNEGAARVRLHRAKQQLRRAYLQLL